MRPQWLSVLLLVSPVSGGAVPAPDPAPDSDLPAVILRAPRPLTPLEAIGTDLAPTVNLELMISPRGTVAELEITSITPSSDLDELFVRAVRESLGGWVFAPAIRAGQPVATEVEWSLEFQPAAADSWSAADATPRITSLVRDEDPEHARLLRIFTLPVERQQAHLAALTARADALIEASGRRRVADNGVVVVTDHPDEQAARAVLSTVHASTATTLGLLGPDLAVHPPRLPLMVYLYRSRSQYDELVRSVEGIVESAGVFCPPGLIALHAEQPTRQHLMSVLVHESVHAALYRWVVRPGHVLPRWVSEGFADYLGSSRIHKGRIEPGEHRGTQVYRAQATLWRGRSLSQLSLDRVRRRIRSGDALSVEAIVAADRETFYGENMGLYYAQSWVLVHFLRHGDDSWADGAFPELMLYLSEGYRAEAALRHVYGLEPAELEDAYREHARRF